MELAAFIGGLVVFFAAHFYTSFRGRGETSIASRLGRGPYMGLYSLVSLAGFVAMVWGFAMVKPIFYVWRPPVWIRHINMTLMLPAMVLIAAAYAPTGYIKKAIGHPMLAAVGLWAIGHLISNGDLAGIILFGSFLLYAVIDRLAVRARGDRGAHGAKANVLGDMIAIAVGLALYGLFVYDLHDRLIGIALMG